MKFQVLSDACNRVASYLGYVPVAQLVAALEAHARVEKELLARVESLELTLSVRGQLTNAVTEIAAVQATNTRNASDTQKAVDKLDGISRSLLDMMKDTWPAAYDLENSKLFPVGTEATHAQQTEIRCDPGSPSGCTGQPPDNRGPVTGGH